MISDWNLMLGLLALLLGSLACVLIRFNLRPPNLIEFLFAGLLVAFAGLRPGGFDFNDYLIMFDTVSLAGPEVTLDRLLVGKDILFGALIVALVELGFGPTSLFIASAALSIGAKLVAFRAAFGTAVLGLAIYFFSFYFLHDFTQIRAAISIAFCFCALVSLIQRRFFLYMTFGTLAVGFHSQAALFMFVTLPLLSGVDRGMKWIWVLSFAICAMVSWIMELVVTFADRPGIGIGGVDASINFLVSSTVNTLLISIAYWVSRGGRTQTTFDRQLSSVAMILVVSGLFFLMATYNVSAALGARAFEMFMSFGVFVIIVAIKYGRALPVSLVCGAYVVFNAVLLLRSYLLVDYDIVEGLL